MQVDPKRLPHWPRVGFAAQCARRVLPLFVEAWPEATLPRLMSVERAIALAEQSAAQQRASEGLHEAALDAQATAGRALMSHHYPAPYELDGPNPTSKDAALVASTVANVAVHAARAASAPDTSGRLALEAFHLALDAIGVADRPGLVVVLEADFEAAAGSTTSPSWWRLW